MWYGRCGMGSFFREAFLDVASLAARPLDARRGDRHQVATSAGDAVVMDWRLKHRGLANNAGEDRPMLYLTYAQPWFVDKCVGGVESLLRMLPRRASRQSSSLRYNFSSDRYDDLPPLVAEGRSRGDRARGRDEEE